MTQAKAGSPRFYGWWLLFFLWVVYTIPVGFIFYGPPILFPFMINELGWSRGDTMTGYALIALLSGLGSPLTAWMIGRLGARTTLFVGGVATSLFAFSMSLISDSYTAYLAFCTLLGLASGPAAFIPIQTVIIFWFDAYRARALGLVLGGGAVGGFFAPQLISSAVTGAGGNWRIGWIMAAAASLLAATIAVLAVRNRPSELGQFPDGLYPGAVDSHPGAARRTGTYRTAAEWPLIDALKTRAMWLLVTATIGSFFAWNIIVTQGPLHLGDRGFGPGDAAFFYSLAIGLSIAGRFSVAALGDVIEPRFIFAFAAFCILTGGILFWLSSPDALWAAYLYPPLVGFGMGAAYICETTMVGNYWGPEAFAKIRGVIGPIVVLLEAGAAPLAGYLYDVQGTYLTVLIFSWVAALIGIVAILLCRPPAPRTSSTLHEP